MTKMEMEGQLIFGNNAGNILKSLKEEKLPLVLWGAGDVAEAVKQYLEQNEIPIAMAWVDGLQEETYLGNLRVTDFEEVKKNFSEFNVILGHSNFDLGDALLQKEKQIHKMYYFVSIFYEQYETIPEQFVKEHLEEYYASYRLFADEESRHAMIAYLNTRMSNDIRYVKQCIRQEQNYFRNDIYQAGGKERYVDVGAFDGDSIRLFLQECNHSYDRIFAFEPEQKNFQRLKEYVKSASLERTELFPIGTWDKKTTLSFTGEEEKRSSISLKANGITIPVDTLDNILENETVTLLKINFMHGALETLAGAEKLLQKNQPRLAVVVGFDEWGLIRIPQYIKKTVPEYRLFLRYNRCMPACLTLYAQV